MSVQAVRRVGLAAAGVVTAGLFVFGAASLASAETAAPSPGASSGTGPGGHGPRGGGAADTPVTGDELAKVTAAMKAKDSAVTVDSVRKDPDGSYDVLGTKAGAKVFYDVSADLKTFTPRTGDGGGGRGGRGHDMGSEVTGDELAKVTAAVKAKDSAVTVNSVRKGSDGTYHVLGTKDGARVMFHASADLQTITQDTRPGK
jgi:hypothetical protein